MPSHPCSMLDEYPWRYGSPSALISDGWKKQQSSNESTNQLTGLFQERSGYWPIRCPKPQRQRATRMLRTMWRSMPPYTLRQSVANDRQEAAESDCTRSCTTEAYNIKSSVPTFKRAGRKRRPDRKRILKKTTEGEEDFWLGVLNYRTTPLEEGRTPGELLMGRRLRSRVPDFSRTPGAQVRKHRQNDGVHCLHALRPGDIVGVASPTGWIVKAKVLRQVAPRSYDVISEDNRVFRRNRQHLKRTQESFCLHGDSDDDEDDGHPFIPSTRANNTYITTIATPNHPNNASSYPNPHHGQVHGQQFRRSARRRHPPTRLSYDENFHQELVNSVSRGKMYRL
ncbi:unnamed protein product [Ixodes pacificus]